MNQRSGTPLENQPAKRGELARKLLKAATRSKRSKVPAPSLSTDEIAPPDGQKARVLGPYPNGTKWRLIVKEATGRKSLVFETREQAESVRATMQTAIEDRASKTIAEIIVEYLDYKRRQGCKERTLDLIQARLTHFLPEHQSACSITPQKAEALYAAKTEKCAVATHQKNLREAKAFYRYSIKQKHVSSNPFANVQSLGKAKAGKPQLRTDEARTLSSLLLTHATEGNRDALALMVQVLLGLRSSEVLNLRKRDLDCGGKVVVVEGTKTANAKRSLELDAPVVRELLVRRCEALAPNALIFAPVGATKAFSTTVLWKSLKRFCKLAGIPSVCPHSLRGLHSTLAVKAGATSTYVAKALGHGSDAITRRHYIAPFALDSVRSARVAGALLGEADLDSLIETLRNLPSEQFDRVCAALSLHR